MTPRELVLLVCITKPYVKYLHQHLVVENMLIHNKKKKNEKQCTTCGKNVFILVHYY